MALQSKARGCREGGGAEDGSASSVNPSVFATSLSICLVSFCATGILHCWACHHDFSCSLQTKRRCWTYFKSVCLDWQDTVGKTGLKLSNAVPGQAHDSRDHAVCLSLGLFPEKSSHDHSVTGIKCVLDTVALPQSGYMRMEETGPQIFGWTVPLSKIGCRRFTLLSGSQNANRFHRSEWEEAVACVAHLGHIGHPGLHGFKNCFYWEHRNTSNSVTQLHAAGCRLF